MSRHFLAIALSLLLSLPLNAWAASWMALAMQASAEPIPAQHDTQAHEHGGHHGMTADQASPQTPGADDHTHGSGDCDEHCMNCASHCFGSGLLRVFSSVLDVGYHLPQTSVGHPLDRAFLLYRPPIQSSLAGG